MATDSETLKEAFKENLFPEAIDCSMKDRSRYDVAHASRHAHLRILKLIELENLREKAELWRVRVSEESFVERILGLRAPIHTDMSDWGLHNALRPAPTPSQSDSRGRAMYLGVCKRACRR